jgi:hypothetical protein
MNTRRALLSALVIATVAAVSFLSNTHADDGKGAASPRTEPARKPIKSGYVAVNGVNYHYQVHGRGEPLLLLHGGLGQIEMFGPVLATLAKHRQVIGVDLHGHGRTALGDRPIRYVDMGDDVAAILRQLGHAQVDVMGIGVQNQALRRALLEYFTWSTTKRMASNPRSASEVPQNLKIARWSMSGLQE